MWQLTDPDKEKLGYHKISKTRRAVLNVLYLTIGPGILERKNKNMTNLKRTLRNIYDNQTSSGAVMIIKAKLTKHF